MPPTLLLRPGAKAGGLALLFLIGVGWSAGYSLNQLAADAGVPPLAYLFWQCAGGGLLVVPFLLAAWVRIPLGPEHLRLYAAAGLFGVVLAYLAIVFAAPHVPVGILMTEVTLEPAFTYVFALLLAIERFSLVRFVGVAFGMGGLLVIVLPETSLPAPEALPWVVLGLAAPMSWAVFNVWIAKVRPPEVGTRVLTFALFASASLMLLPALVLSGQWWWFSLPFGDGEWATLGAALYNPFIWYVAINVIRVWGPVFYSSWAYIGTPAGMLWGWLLFGHELSHWIYIALAPLMAGLFLVNRTTRAARAAGS